MIEIKPSPTADSRTCDYKTVSEETLLDSSKQHISDVAKGLELFSNMLTAAAKQHDFDKLSEIKHFHNDFQTGFKETGWWDEHRKLNRHHINVADGVPSDVNMIDVIEHIVDCVVAGMARSGSVYDLSIPDSVLQQAFKNTVELLKKEVVVAS